MWVDSDWRSVMIGFRRYLCWCFYGEFFVVVATCGLRISKFVLVYSFLLFCTKLIFLNCLQLLSLLRSMLRKSFLCGLMGGVSSQNSGPLDVLVLLVVSICEEKGLISSLFGVPNESSNILNVSSCSWCKLLCF